uniref:Uncharacterized protein n=1 Tax=Anguilla anguilla TaxID=7936 RepID=A0A0E9X3M9_ANGAN
MVQKLGSRCRFSCPNLQCPGNPDHVQPQTPRYGTNGSVPWLDSETICTNWPNSHEAESEEFHAYAVGKRTRLNRPVPWATGAPIGNCALPPVGLATTVDTGTVRFRTEAHPCITAWCLH